MPKEESVSTSLDTELSELLGRLTGDMSTLAVARTLVDAKAVYEELHPESRHGGDRRNRVVMVPSFAGYVAARTGIPKRTVERRVAEGEKLKSLDPEAEEAVYGTALANMLGLLVRVAAIPKAELQRDLVNIFDRSRRKATRELERWEEHFGLRQEEPTEPDEGQAEEESNVRFARPWEDDDDADSFWDDDDGNLDGAWEGDPDDDAESGSLGNTDYSPSPEDAEEHLSKIMEMLAVGDPDECVPVIEDLLNLQAKLQRCEHEAHQARRKAEQLEKDLSLYTQGKIGELFTLLGAKDIKTAIAKAKKLMEAADAA